MIANIIPSTVCVLATNVFLFMGLLLALNVGPSQIPEVEKSEEEDDPLKNVNLLDPPRTNEKLPTIKPVCVLFHVVHPTIRWVPLLCVPAVLED